MSLCFWLGSIGPSLALELRVAVEKNVGELTVGSSTPARVRSRSGDILGDVSQMNAFVARSHGGVVSLDRWQGEQLWIEPTNHGYVYIGDRWYRGKVLIVQGRWGLTAVNYVDIESYLYSVLGAEMGGTWPLEALKAQAVAARSYVLYQRERYGNQIYDVGNDTFWQVYRGMQEESSQTHRATEATRGQVLSHNGQVIEAVFHSSSGGHTEDVEQVWDEAKPYLRGVPDFDSNSPSYHWMESFSQWELTRRLGGVGTVTGIFPQRESPNGRLVTAQVVGTAGSTTIKGDDLRSALGLRSSLFTVASGGDYFTLSGRGFGHGVGLSQWGARHLAEQGYSYRQILSHYYRNTQLAQLRPQS
ncbi:SpoIID/LytB domain-containing protein [Phormidium yuhuli AB48]|uniref:SpoIID/LytB domain-containing protein n=1 Tax=Phormidium yuhuli AB48 TaxID=2940671 RepID=A0ABY5ASI4_9CYAN|nr:SpoIID/LytB domain-containing protein [Phormidium yuhuli]USR91792.1 SpoIID/LytB domain-containing protein [Phormidium yuhuli AB48]